MSRPTRPHLRAAPHVAEETLKSFDGNVFDPQNPPPAFFNLFRFFLRCRALEQQLARATELQAAWLDPLHRHGTLPLVHLRGQQEQVATALSDVLCGKKSNDSRCGDDSSCRKKQSPSSPPWDVVSYDMCHRPPGPLSSSSPPQTSNAAKNAGRTKAGTGAAVTKPSVGPTAVSRHSSDCPLLALYQQWHDRARRVQHKRQVLAALLEEEEREEGDSEGGSATVSAKTAFVAADHGRESAAAVGKSDSTLQAVDGKQQRRHGSSDARPNRSGPPALTRAETLRIFLSPFASDEVVCSTATAATDTAIPSLTWDGSIAAPSSPAAATAGMVNPDAQACRVLLEEALSTSSPPLAQCPICGTLLHIQSIWITLHVLQLMNAVCHVQLAVAPRRLPIDVLHMPPMRAVGYVFHLAGKLSRSALALLLTVVSDETPLAFVRHQQHHDLMETVAEAATVSEMDVCSLPLPKDVPAYSTPGMVTSEAAAGQLARRLVDLVHTLLSTLDDVFPVLTAPIEQQQQQSVSQGTPENASEAAVVLMVRVRLLHLLLLALISPGVVPMAVNTLAVLAKHPRVFGSTADTDRDCRSFHGSCATSNNDDVGNVSGNGVLAVAQRVYHAFASSFTSHERGNGTGAELAEVRVVMVLGTVFLSLVHARDLHDAHTDDTTEHITEKLGRDFSAKESASSSYSNRQARQQQQQRMSGRTSIDDDVLRTHAATAANLLDGPLMVTLQTLRDASDGAVAARARRLQALAWTLRAELSRALMANRDERVIPNTSKGTAAAVTREIGISAQDALKEAVDAHEDAREFTSFSIVHAMVASRGKKPTMSGRGGQLAWRLWQQQQQQQLQPQRNENGEQGDDGGDSSRLPFAMLPPAWIRLWTLLCPCVFPSSFADLLASPAMADMDADGNEGETLPVNAADYQPTGRQSRSVDKQSSLARKQAPMQPHSAGGDPRTEGTGGSASSRASPPRRLAADWRSFPLQRPRKGGTGKKEASGKLSSREQRAGSQSGGGNDGKVSQKWALQKQQQQQQQLLSVAEVELKRGLSPPSFWWRWRCFMIGDDSKASVHGPVTSFLNRQPCYQTPLLNQEAHDDNAGNESITKRTDTQTTYVDVSAHETTINASIHAVLKLVTLPEGLDKMEACFPVVHHARDLAIWCIRGRHRTDVTAATEAAGNEIDASSAQRNSLFPDPTIVIDPFEPIARQFAETVLPAATQSPLTIRYSRCRGTKKSENAEGSKEVSEQHNAEAASVREVHSRKLLSEDYECSLNTVEEEVGSVDEGPSRPSDPSALSAPPLLPPLHTTVARLSLPSSGSSPFQSPLASTFSPGHPVEGGMSCDNGEDSHRTRHGMIRSSLRASRDGSPALVTAALAMHASVPQPPSLSSCGWTLHISSSSASSTSGGGGGRQMRAARMTRAAVRGRPLQRMPSLSLSPSLPPSQPLPTMLPQPSSLAGAASSPPCSSSASRAAVEETNAAILGSSATPLAQERVAAVEGESRDE